MKKLRIIPVVIQSTGGSHSTIKTFVQRGVTMQIRIDQYDKSKPAKVNWILGLSRIANVRRGRKNYPTYLKTETVVNVYGVSREYGGPEEGGWYYDCKHLLRSKKYPNARLAQYHADKLEKGFGVECERNYNLGWIQVRVEHMVGQSETKYRPHYE